MADKTWLCIKTGGTTFTEGWTYVLCESREDAQYLANFLYSHEVVSIVGRETLEAKRA